MSKIKVLITGPVSGSIADVTAKLTSLQNSKAGPFDMCFCVGPFFNHTQSTTASLEEINMPLPVYFVDVGVLPDGMELPSIKVVSKDEAEISIDDDSPAKDHLDLDENGDDELIPKGIIKVAPNLYHLHGISMDDTQTADILNIPCPGQNNSKEFLTVAFLPPNARMKSAQTTTFESKTKHASYVGCDVLLTSDWGQGMVASRCISKEDKVNLVFEGEVGSYDIAEVASQCRPRYHIAPALLQQSVSVSTPSNEIGIKMEEIETGAKIEDPIASTTSFFIQSLPYTNPPSALSSGVMKNYHTSRFLALCPVVDAATQKANGKAKKYIHALGIQPLWSMDRVTATAIPENTVVVPCPYTDDSYQKDGMGGNGNKHGHGHESGNNGVDKYANVGLSEAQTRRILSENAGGNEGNGDYRWNIKNRKRPLDNQDPQLAAAVDPANCTLFLHGLHSDTTRGNTLNQDSILNAFQGMGCVRVRFPSTQGHPSYCFLDYGTHQEAKACLEENGGEAEVLGIQLTMRWSSGGNRRVPPPPPPGHVGMYHGQNDAKRSKTRLTEAEAADSSSLFVHLNLSTMSEELCSRGIQHVGTLAQKMLEDAINADGGEERVTADDEPALKVTARPLVGKQNCGFLDFASHAAASMALATMTGSTDGGELQQDGATDDVDLKDALREVQLWWARAKDPSGGNDGGDGNGFQFRSQHFPADARTDCWFCLASPSCEKHLIVSVSDNCYLTMPKGPVNKHHALCVPVNHSASDGGAKRPIIGAFLDPTPGAVEDLEEAKDKLRKYASEELDKDLFVFERAIPTRGGYHAHINCIPVDRGLGSKIRTTMLSLAAGTNRGSGFELRELQNPDISVTNILKNEDDLVGYFYAEVPFGERGDVKRFLYTAVDQGNGSRKQVPLQFGREVLASVLDDENLAHWKGCVLSNEVEEEYTESFRKTFAKYE